jgi:hypothetical protein
MDLLFGRTVSQIKNRYYQNLKGKDISKIKYKTEIEVPETIVDEQCKSSKKRRRTTGKENIEPNTSAKNKRTQKAAIKTLEKEFNTKICLNLEHESSQATSFKYEEEPQCHLTSENKHCFSTMENSPFLQTYQKTNSRSRIAANPFMS